MRVALIGDVHANLPALEAVLEHADEQEVEAIWNVGDFVGYGAFPNQVVKRLRQEQAVSIVGNYDRKVVGFKKKRDKWRKKKQAQKFLAFQWAHHTLTRKNHKYLRSLPEERELRIDGLRVLLTHASPASPREHLTLETSQQRLQELASLVETDVVVCGHSHRPFAREAGGVQFINTGSVGRPDDGDPRACYAVLDVGGRGLRVCHHRVAYDVGRAASALREQALPEAFAQMAILGHALDDVMKAPQEWDVPLEEPVPWDETDEERRLRMVRRLAESCEYEEEHSRHVTQLSLQLFDELRSLHYLGAEERSWLLYGGLLHDIGWVEGRKGHHKTSLRLILNGLDSPFDERERRIIGSIARYHRGALPKDKHDHFAALSPIDQYRVTILSALLRVADGLDRTHRNVVQDLSCDLSPHRIGVRCAVCMYPVPERDAALEKGDLLERAFDRELLIEWQPV